MIDMIDLFLSLELFYTLFVFALYLAFFFSVATTCNTQQSELKIRSALHGQLKRTARSANIQKTA